MEAIFKMKSVYGNDHIYPVNSKAWLLTLLTKKSTVDHNDLALIKALGYTVIIN